MKKIALRIDKIEKLGFEQTTNSREAIRTTEKTT